ncbi:MAG: hypothetical protein K2N48_01390 [Muribaculaceae bacterium]|nr:hypothetical protein [Muribaculaceae bacterium]
MTQSETAQKMLDVFFRHPETKNYDAKALTEERSFDQEDFDELMSDIASEFSVDIPMKPAKYIYAPPGIDKDKFTIQQLADYVETLLNTQQS